MTGITTCLHGSPFTYGLVNFTQGSKSKNNFESWWGWGRIIRRHIHHKYRVGFGRPSTAVLRQVDAGVNKVNVQSVLE